MTEEAAKRFYDSGEWKNWTHEELARFQLIEDRLCVPFEVFHEAVEKVLGRSVWTHEFGMNRDGLIAELFGGPAPSMQEIVEMIPADKRIVLEIGGAP